MDEAYVDFVSDPPNYTDARHFLNRGKPLVGLRTFSKVYSLAGLRLGFAFGTEPKLGIDCSKAFVYGCLGS